MEAERGCLELVMSRGATEAMRAVMTGTPTEPADETGMGSGAAGNEHATSWRGSPDMASTVPTSP